MSISVGDKIPDVKLVKATAEGPQPVQSANFLQGGGLHYSRSQAHSRQPVRHGTCQASLKRRRSLRQGNR